MQALAETDTGRARIEGRLARVIFAAPGEGFAVPATATAEGNEVRVAGSLAHLQPEASVRISGRVTVHSRHGCQVQVEKVEEVEWPGPHHYE